MANTVKKETSFIRRRSDGRIELRLTYYDDDGIMHKKSFYGKTEEECYEQASTFKAVQDYSFYSSDTKITIPEILRQKYEDDLHMNYVGEAAYDRNIQSLKRIEKSKIGNIPIIFVTEQQILLFLKSLTHYSNSVISKTHQQLKLAYNIAIEDDIVGKNLMNSRKLKRCPKSVKKDKEVKGFTEEEQIAFLAALESDRIPRHRNNYKNQLKLELFTGMRMGEINTLKVSDIDLNNNVIHVRRTITRGMDYKESLREGAKTEAGMRDVPINELAKEVLEDAIKHKPRNKLGLLFYDKDKKKLISTTQVNNYFHRLCKKAGIEERGQHALRHTFATRCIEAGVPAVVLKTWLGHTDIHVTLDTYADVFSRMNNDAMRKFEDYSSSLFTA